MDKFTVYSTQNCMKCFATKRAMDSYGMDHEDLFLEDDPDMLAEAKAEGHVAAPIVVAPDGSMWSDYRPDLVKAWANALGLEKVRRK